MTATDDVPAAGGLFGDPRQYPAGDRGRLDHFSALLAAGVVEGSSSGGLLVALERIRAKQTAAQASTLRVFDAAGAHDADGCGSSSAWLAVKAGIAKKAARAAVRQSGS
jgi:hypothetical protein